MSNCLCAYVYVFGITANPCVILNYLLGAKHGYTRRLDLWGQKTPTECGLQGLIDSMSNVIKFYHN